MHNPKLNPEVMKLTTKYDGLFLYCSCWYIYTLQLYCWLASEYEFEKKSERKTFIAITLAEESESGEAQTKSDDDSGQNF